MGIIKAATSTIGGTLADQWLDIIEPEQMDNTTLMSKGIFVRQNNKRGSNKRASEDYITDGSVIRVYPNMMMLLVDGGKIIDYTAEEGYYTVDNQAAPSLFNGQLQNVLNESFDRFKFGGITPQKQEVFFINLQEVRGIRFGTKQPINYFDNFYNAELFLRAHGNYSIQITDPILFYKNVVPKGATRLTIDEINEQFLAEFVSALQTSINQMSVDGLRISYLASKTAELSRYMNQSLDDQWRQLRGMEIVSIAIASISYTDDSQKLINMRNKGAMLSDPTIRDSFVQGSIAAGIEAAGNNPNGAGNAFFGLGMGMQAAGDYLSQAAKNNQAATANNTNQASNPTWHCPDCHQENTGKFCSNCGKAKVQAVPSSQASLQMKCSHCQHIVQLDQGIPKFCPECGQPFLGQPL
ncbi:SPFH domain-containing protein [Enterococcus columbae]|uniref:SPFH domain-containing protein n=1 Tax=Enterococcus columbae DSM 7374 = ATCC 51263 TaxID=1121865 RepID=S0KAW0_9ENTE|nr:SPFH domain-containing protein [Enterococcus columbae]EOT41812.1 hypothetical protein OMW_01225 [Enterococcus columbae DSM 7374 = ATCC 51263]EOW80666.1 hypothetical protein I568_01844 [Enterococcus columbae DSM 7374 = ATCC 51263]OJG21914.1 hypothetical protein RR47_GL001118 [Enterococcus columbae DSM 7374 = ATCC 51263]